MVKSKRIDNKTYLTETPSVRALQIFRKIMDDIHLKLYPIDFQVLFERYTF